MMFAFEQSQVDVQASPAKPENLEDVEQQASMQSEAEDLESSSVASTQAVPEAVSASDSGSECIMVTATACKADPQNQDIQTNAVHIGFKIYMDWSKRTLCKLFEDGRVEEPQKLIPGPEGFQMAVFSDGEAHETELPNPLVPHLPVHNANAVCKKPAANVMKKPASASRSVAAAEETGSESAEEDDAVEVQPNHAPEDYPSQLHLMTTRSQPKNHNSLSIWHLSWITKLPRTSFKAAIQSGRSAP
jgi:hypothetical protein